MKESASSDAAARAARVAARRASRPERLDPVQAYSIDETCAALDISRAQFYVLRNRGVLRVLSSIDGRPRVSGAEIARLTSGAP